MSLDPKGEHALLTSKHRTGQGQRVYVLDPFNITKGQVERHSFNPLAEIDPDSPRAKNDIKQIADACVITAATSISEGGEHFRGLATTVITGLIAHVLTKLPKGKRTLPEVYKHFKALRKKEDFENFLPEMEQNPACGNAPSDAVAAYLGSPDKNRGDIFTTMLNALEWVSTDGMREHLSRSDLSLEELRMHRTTIYVVLDFDDMKPRVQGRYMRVLFNLALRKSYVTPLPQDRKEAGRRTLFILDEVGQLGFMPSIQEAYRSHAGENVKLWCFFQDLKALTSTFNSPNALLGNSTSQFFGCKDAETAHFIEDHLGEYRHRRKDGNRIHETTKPLLDHSEVMDTLKQESPMQIVITGGGYRLKLKRKIHIPPEDWNPQTSGEFAHWLTPVRAGLFVALLIAVFIVAEMNDLPWWGYVLIGFAALFVWRRLFRRDGGRPILAMIDDAYQNARYGGETGRYYEYLKSRIWKGWMPNHPWFQHSGIEKIDALDAGDPRRGEMLAWLWEWKSDCYKKSREEVKGGLVTFYRCAYVKPEMSMEAYKFMLALKARAEREGVQVDAGFLDEESRIYTPERAAAVEEALQAEQERQAGEARTEEPEKKPESEAESEEVGEGIKKSHQKQTESADSRYSPEAEAACEEQEEASSSYTPEQDAARQRFYLPEGFTLEQLKARYTELAERLAMDQIDQLTTDYNILLSVVKDEAEDEDKKD